jgi:hypothetical protein
MRPSIRCSLLGLALLSGTAAAALPPCNSGYVYHDVDGDGRFGAGDQALAGVAVSDGERVVRTDATGAYALPVQDGRTVFVIKPPGYRFPDRNDGLPDFWRHVQRADGPVLKYGGIAAEFPHCRNFALRAASREPGKLDVLLFGDPQPQTARQVEHYDRGIVEAVRRAHSSRSAAAQVPPTYFPGAAGDLGLSLGDVVHDDLSLYPAMNRATARLGVPWLHLAGNHDLDFDATRDEDSLRSFRATYGPDTLAWEEHEASFVLLDNVVYQPGQSPDYIGGLRADQFAFLEAYLPSLPRDRRLVLAAHIPFFDPVPGRETFRRADRERLFALLKEFPKLLLLSAHGHVQRHHWHDADDGWLGATPLHEYNVGAACGAFWSGVADAQGIPDATMADGTPKGWAELAVGRDGRYGLRWRSPDGDFDRSGMALHAPKLLRRGAYPAFGVYANVFMGDAQTRVEFRVDGGAWLPMRRVDRADPRLLVQNMLDDSADTLRGFDRSPEAAASSHLWRGTLPTDLASGEHRIDVRAFDRWRGELSASRTYRLADAAE